MALKECKECKKEIATTAKICPHCGCSDPHNNNTIKGLIGVVFFALCLGSCVICVGNLSETDTDTSEVVVEQQKQVVEEKVISVEEIKRKANVEKNIQSIVSVLDEYYNIRAKDIWNKDTGKYCNNGGCVLSIHKGDNRVSIQTIGPWIIEVRIDSEPTPDYYQQVCSAVLMALTGNPSKQRAESIINKLFYAADMSGLAKLEIMGVEITVKHSWGGDGPLEYSFYKRN